MMVGQMGDSLSTEITYGRSVTGTSAMEHRALREEAREERLEKGTSSQHLKINSMTMQSISTVVRGPNVPYRLK